MHENDAQRMRLDRLVAVFRQRHTPAVAPCQADICPQEMETINLCIADGIFSETLLVAVVLNSMGQI